MLQKELSLATLAVEDGWSIAVPANFLVAKQCRVRWIPQAVQIELSGGIPAAWIGPLRTALLAAARDEFLQRELQGRAALPWPGIDEGDVLRSPRVHLWARTTDFGKALVLTAAIAPCSNCWAPLAVGAKRCWDCGQGLGMFGFLRKKG